MTRARPETNERAVISFISIMIDRAVLHFPGRSVPSEVHCQYALYDNKPLDVFMDTFTAPPDGAVLFSSTENVVFSL